ncbi:MAG: Oligosaccharide translocation protein rft1 [Chaenotheca gracillima]|nr:MAG: Oligosaccharide translocation protein rft1 [Chaenotheca gracillima]
MSKKTLLSSSAQGATFLIIFQVGSRALTFLVNQILLRYLSPELLGISTQLELYLISVLYFARESVRVAVQRQSDGGPDATNADKNPIANGQGGAPKGRVSEDSAAGKTQTVVNISYISIVLGIPLVFGFGYLYLSTASPLILRAPFIRESLKLYGVAAFCELLSEPCFVVAQQKLLYKSRAAAETAATLFRCVLTCVVAVLSARGGRNLGVLPFAIGQMGYALALLIIYYATIWKTAANGGFSLSFLPISSADGRSGSPYLFSLFSIPLLYLSGSLFIQSGIKHLLTQGDALMIAALASLTDQGTYALASNYGGLIARMLFQPIEESSRNLFAKLLSPTQAQHPKPDAANVRAASSILTDIVRLYLLLSIVASAIGPVVAPLLLQIIAGPTWTSSGAGAVLSTYCYYIPLLALNGVTEAFVSAVATSAELHVQSMWMFVFSMGFAGASYIFLSILGWGARGLVWANMANMLVRILWSIRFVQAYLRRNEAPIKPRDVLPTGASVAAGFGAAAMLTKLEQSFTGEFNDFVISGAVAGPFLLILLYFERIYLLQCYNQLTQQPSVRAQSGKSR